MGKRRGESDVAFTTHEAYYSYCKEWYDALLIENVPAYKQAIIERQLGPEWTVKGVILDPRIFGIAAARTRLYALAYRTSKVTWRPEVDMLEVLDVLSSRVVGGAGMWWWENQGPSTLTPAQVLWV